MQRVEIDFLCGCEVFTSKTTKFPSQIDQNFLTETAESPPKWWNHLQFGGTTSETAEVSPKISEKIKYFKIALST